MEFRLSSSHLDILTIVRKQNIKLPREEISVPAGATSVKIPNKNNGAPKRNTWSL